MRDAILYEGVWLCKGSKAHELHLKAQKEGGKAWLDLRTHMSILDQEYKKLHGIK